MNTLFRSDANSSVVILLMWGKTNKARSRYHPSQGIVPVSGYMFDRLSVSFDDTAKEASLFGLFVLSFTEKSFEP